MKRYDTLCRQLDSILAQTIYAPLFLSISVVPELYKEVYEKLETYRESVHIFWRLSQLSQFEHYALLTNEIMNLVEYKSYNLQNIWYIFCDDDDFCHPDRVKWYTENIKLYQNIYDTIFPIDGCMCVYKDGSLTMTYSDLLEYERKKPETISHIAYEYWMFATHADLFKLFCDNSKTNLNNKYCDICFRNFIRKTNLKFVKSDTWLYAKTMDKSFDHVSLDLLEY